MQELLEKNQQFLHFLENGYKDFPFRYRYILRKQPNKTNCIYIIDSIGKDMDVE